MDDRFHPIRCSPALDLYGIFPSAKEIKEKVKSKQRKVTNIILHIGTYIYFPKTEIYIYIYINGSFYYLRVTVENS